MIDGRIHGRLVLTEIMMNLAWQLKHCKGIFFSGAHLMNIWGSWKRLSDANVHTAMLFLIKKDLSEVLKTWIICNECMEMKVEVNMRFVPVSSIMYEDLDGGSGKFIYLGYRLSNLNNLMYLACILHPIMEPMVLRQAPYCVPTTLLPMCTIHGRYHVHSV